MILVDTSVWVDHLRNADERMSWLLGRTRILVHPFVMGELALHTIGKRGPFLRDLERLPRANVARQGEVMALIETHALFGRGIGYVDTHLFASAMLTPGVQLWTKDKRLRAVAEVAGLDAKLDH